MQRKYDMLYLINFWVNNHMRTSSFKKLLVSLSAQGVSTIISHYACSFQNNSILNQPDGSTIY